MTEEKKVLTNEDIQARADELSRQFNVKVQPLVFVEPETGEQVVGYYKEPSRITKARVLDKAYTEPITATLLLLDSVLIKEASDYRIYSEASEFDKFNLGAATALYEVINISINTFKKK